MVAARSTDVAYIVLLAGPGVPGSEIIPAQSALIARAMGAYEKQVEKSTANLRRMIAVVTSEPDDKVAGEKLTALARETLKRSVTADDQDRLAREFLAAVEKETPNG